MITYIEKGAGLHSTINDAGYYLKPNTNDEAFDFEGNQSAGIDSTVQAIIDGYNPLSDYKELKIVELKIEGLSRINAVMPAINSFDDLQLIREQWLSIIPASRNATAAFQSVIDIYQAGVDGVAAINALTTEADVLAFDVVNDVVW